MSNYIYEILHVNIVCSNASKVYGDDDPVFTGKVYLDDLKTEYTGILGTIIYDRINADVNDVGYYPKVITAIIEDQNPAITYSVINGDFEIKEIV